MNNRRPIPSKVLTTFVRFFGFNYDQLMFADLSEAVYEVLIKVNSFAAKIESTYSSLLRSEIKVTIDFCSNFVH